MRNFMLKYFFELLSIIWHFNPMNEWFLIQSYPDSVVLDQDYRGHSQMIHILSITTWYRESTTQCDTWSWVNTHWSVTLFRVIFNTSTEFNMAKYHTLMCINPRPSVTLWCGALLYSHHKNLTRTINFESRDIIWLLFGHTNWPFKEDLEWRSTAFIHLVQQIIITGHRLNQKWLRLEAVRRLLK